MVTVELGPDGNSVAELSSLNLDTLCFLGLVLHTPYIVLGHHVLCVFFLSCSGFNLISLVKEYFGLILPSFAYFKV